MGTGFDSILLYWNSLPTKETIIIWLKLQLRITSVDWRYKEEKESLYDENRITAHFFVLYIYVYTLYNQLKKNSLSICLFNRIDR